jgi:cyclic pyranopterin phosphate synthase
MATPRTYLPVLQATPVATFEGPPPTSLVDNFARRIRYLRVSVTDRCNYRCSYCAPDDIAGDLAFAARAEILSFEEIERLAAVFARLGVRKLRLTGGEPTVRKGIVDLVGRLVRIPGIEQVVMTTNGHLLAELAGPLAAAGLTGVNISLDTLDPGRFRALTGGGDLERVQAGLEAALAAGLRVKTNAVALRGVNDNELLALCEYAWARGVTPRFIEHMPMSSGVIYERSAELSSAAIREALAMAVGPLVPVEADRDAGPARTWMLAADPTRRVGIISAMTDHFCGDCNRLRLTAAGDLHACLGHDDALSLRDAMRRGDSDEGISNAIAAVVVGKREGHEFLSAAPGKHMISIGG